MKSILLTTALAFAVLPTVSANALNSNFAERKVREINSEGRDVCRSLRGAGYRATVKGIIQGNSRSGYTNFQVKTCFNTASQCGAFIGNINHVIGKIETVRYAKCKPY